MAPLKGNNERRIRVIESNTDYEEMAAGHIIPGADPPKNDHARGGFGDRDGRNGFGTDAGEGMTALSMNEDSEDPNAHTDGLQTSAQLNNRPPSAVVEDAEDDVDTDDDLDTDFETDDVPDDIDDADFEEADFAEEDDLDDVDLDEDFDEEEEDDDV